MAATGPCWPGGTGLATTGPRLVLGTGLTATALSIAWWYWPGCYRPQVCLGVMAWLLQAAGLPQVDLAWLLQAAGCPGGTGLAAAAHRGYWPCCYRPQVDLGGYWPGCYRPQVGLGYWPGYYRPQVCRGYWPQYSLGVLALLLQTPR